jgi:hypothetical protein
MIALGDVISVTESDSTKQYMIAERLTDIGRQEDEGGWLCIEMGALTEKGIDNISAFDCWRITDRYLAVQLERGVITIPKFKLTQNED